MKKCLLIVAIVFAIIANFSCSMAATTDGVTLNLKSSSTSVSVGDTFTVTLSQQCSDGLICIDATVDYDTDIFELTDKKLASNWENNFGDGENITPAANTPQKNGDVIVLTFKALTNNASGTISLTGIEAYKDYDDIVSMDDESVTVTVGTSSSGNTGSGNTGSGSTGSGYTGSGSAGNGSTGSGSTGSGSTGSGSAGNGSTGSGSTGSGSTGSGSTGSGSAGSGSTGSGSTGNGSSSQSNYSGMNSGSSTPNVTAVAGTTNVNKSGDSSELPYTGTKSAIVILVVGVLGGIAVFLFRKNQMYKGI